LLDAAYVPRIGSPGLDLVLRVEGGSLRDRIDLCQYVYSQMEQDNYWRDWLKLNGVFISYTTPPGNILEVTEAAVPTADELVAINDVLQLSLDEIEMEPDLSGAYVDSATLLKPVVGPGRVLKVNGRVVDENQIPLLKSVVEHAAASQPSWDPFRCNVSILLDGVVVGSPDRERSNRFFSLALEEFWRCNFLRAKQAIVRAIADDPTSPILQYWQVIMHIRLGEEDRAKRKLAPLLAQDPWGSNSPVIATALERVQGPVRQRMRELEKQVLLTMLP
jgi:hypothetical protein